MEIAQELTTNDIKEGLVRVSTQNLDFFHNGENRSEGHKLQILLPDGKSYSSSITFNPSTGAPRFLKDIRGPLRAFYQKVDAKPGDALKIKRVANDDFAFQYVPRITSRGQSFIDEINTELAGSKSIGFGGSPDSRPSDAGKEPAPPIPAPIGSRSSMAEPRMSRESLRDVRSKHRLDEDIDSASNLKYPIEDIQQRAIKTRRGQPDFRKRIFAAYDNRCAITGCRIQSVLEAAHIIPHAEGTDWDISNGLPLRADIHTLFDLRLLTVAPDYRIHISRDLAGADYEQLHGQKINLPRNKLNYPAPEKLAKHFEGFEERNSKEE